MILPQDFAQEVTSGFCFRPHCVAQDHGRDPAQDSAQDPVQGPGQRPTRILQHNPAQGLGLRLGSRFRVKVQG